MGNRPSNGMFSVKQTVIGELWPLYVSTLSEVTRRSELDNGTTLDCRVTFDRAV